MVTSTVTGRTTKQEVELDVTDAPPIEIDEAPWSVRKANVNAIRISYETLEVIVGNIRQAEARVTGIAYETDDQESIDGEVFVHPDFLDKPDEWPDWVRALVDEHRPTT